MYLWNLRDGCHCWSGWFLNLSLQTLAQVAAELVCSWTREEAERCYKKSASKEEGRDIYSLGSKGRTGIWRVVCLGNKDFFECWQSWLELISEQNKLLRNWGGHVLTPFFDTCQERWFIEERIADPKGNRCKRLESADGVIADEPEEYYEKMLIRRVWWSANRSCRWVRRKEEEVEIYEDSDDSVVIF